MINRSSAVVLCLVLGGLVIFRADLSSTQTEISPPQWVGIYDVEGRVGLIWIKDPVIAYYKVYRRSLNDKKFTLIGGTHESRYEDHDVQPGEVYHYLLVGVTEKGQESRPSATATFSTKGEPAEADLSIEWEGYLVLDKGIGLKWEPLDSVDVVTYNIYRQGPGEKSFKLLSSTQKNLFVDEGVEDGHEYLYRISALDKNFKEGYASIELTAEFHKEPVREGEIRLDYSWNPRKTALLETVIGSRDHKLFAPTDVTLSKKGQLFVADSGNSLIQVFTSRGAFLFSFPVPPMEGGRDSYPLGLTIDSNGQACCTDAYNGRILFFSEKGQLLENIVLPRKTRGERFGLLGICQVGEGRFYAVDNFNRRLAVIDRQTKSSSFFGKAGFGPGELAAPVFCTVGPSDEVIVTDALGGCVHFFGSDGRFIKTFGQYGRTVGALARPKGIALDSRGRIYIADSLLCQIQAFDAAGKYLYTLADEYGKPLDLGSPNGIYIDRNDVIYIAERLAHRVQIRQIQDD